MNCESLIEVVKQNVEVEPGRVPYRFLVDDGREESLSYAELDNAAKIIAANLRAGCRPGDRALLLFHPGLEYIKALFGCFYAGVVAVPVYPPTNQRNSERIKLIADNAGISIALTDSRLSDRMQQFFDTPDWLIVDKPLSLTASDYSEYPCSAGSLAFLQYTSGSTGNPKGVMLSHGNLLHNAMMTAKAMNVNRSSVFVSWLPPYHDMGLIGTMLEPLLESAEMVLMSPAAFVQRPYRWLKAISDYRATISGGPNFAYDLCVQKISEEQKSSLDLSCWQVAFNGSEPVRRETLDAFVSAFEQCGFKRKAFHPCYGMAETTLIVSGGGLETEPVIKRIDAQALEQNIVLPSSDGGKGGIDCVGCGCSMVDQGVLIVDPETGVPCPPDRIGEIWVAGDSVAQGYWNLSEDEANPFGAYPVDSDRGPFLRTGDLGFMDDGQLFITGRLKDLIILNGRNLYPQDIERCSWKSHSSLRPNATAAFSCVIEGVEELVVVQELGFRNKVGTESILSSVRRAISEEFQVQPYAIVLTRPGNVPVTSSGKIRRRECRRLYESGNIKQEALWLRDHDEFAEAFDSAIAVPDVEGKQNNVGMQNAVEAGLRRIWAELLALETGAIGIDDNFFDLGGYSMLAVQLQRNINKYFNVN
ncbi:MAG TPA: AMP-binding protein, partial [Gammaproteobacteria bacterium]